MKTKEIIETTKYFRSVSIMMLSSFKNDKNEWDYSKHRIFNLEVETKKCKLETQEDTLNFLEKFDLYYNDCEVKIEDHNTFKKYKIFCKFSGRPLLMMHIDDSYSTSILIKETITKRIINNLEVEDSKYEFFGKDEETLKYYKHDDQKSFFIYLSDVIEKRKI